MVTGKTPNLGLPQYMHGDHPDFLGEINDAYMKIDADISKLRTKSSITEQALASVNEELEALRKILEEVINDGKN